MDELIKMLMGTPPEQIENVYFFLIYMIEVFIRIGIFGFILRLVSNLFSFLGGSKMSLFK